MSHAPEWPQLYVCQECNLVYAGVHGSEDEEHEFRPPESCSGCGNGSFTEIERMPVH